MTYLFRFSRAVAAASALAFAGLIAIAPAHASTVSGGSPGINGFNDPQGFTLNDGGFTSPSPSISSGTLQITADEVDGQENSAICNVKQDVGAFSVSFTYQENYDPSFSEFSPADGVTFVIENDPRGVNAVGGGGSDLGYSNEQGSGVPAIKKSAAIALNIFDGHTSGTNLLTGGRNPGFIYDNISPVDLTSGDPINVTLNYDGTTLTETIIDENTLDTYNAQYTVNIPVWFGATTAYVGFTGSTGAGTANQYISNFTYSTSPVLTIEPNPVLGGKSATGTINLLYPVATKTLVRLSSSDPTNAMVKDTIYVSAGHSTVTFAIDTQGVQNPEDVTISAQLLGMQLQRSLTINSPNLIADSVQFSANPIVGGNYEFASVNISSPAPAGGLTVNLGIKNNSYGAVTGFFSGAPSDPTTTSITSVTIPAGATSASFVINTNLVPTSVTVTIQGNLNGITRGAGLNIIPPPAE